ncbi:MAG: ribonucleotide reductase [Anaerolineae bacterium SG8_19]|nr:MAG: ribonucleotide reductase [Anaerolineae bacterium SG8_19]
MQSITLAQKAVEDRPRIKLSENSQAVLERRYLRRGEDGKPVESVEGMFYRVASHVAKGEAEGDGDVAATTEKFYQLLTEFRFMPNSPTFTGAGTPLGQLAACFVLPVSDDMGRNQSGIFQTLRDAALIQQTGGGNGFSFSRLRPKGALVKSSAGQATGPVGFLRVYDQAFGEIAQGGTRRGANMAVLRVDHPDIADFITCKTDENQITNFNISVGITDKFMQSVAGDEDFELVNPQDGAVWKTIPARQIFEMIVKQAHHNGEPGVLFLDAANRQNPVPQLYELEATNPCGEQWLGPYENCCLGSVNLANHKGQNGTVDWLALQKTVEMSTRFLDDVVTTNAYVPAVSQLKEAAFRARRIGLGIMGLADLMYHSKIRYGSEKAQQFAGQVMEFVRYHCMRTSIELAKERGPFLAIKGSIYDPEDLTWRPPKPLFPYRHDFGRPGLDWDSVVEGIRLFGIRNAAQTTVAPTGTIATVAGCEGYGCEPVFALAYLRHVNDNGADLELQYTSPLFEQALIEADLDLESRQHIIASVSEIGSCQQLEEIPDHIRDTFVVAADISPEEHVRMQAAIQAFVDNSISKTCNFPAHATEEDVADAYRLAWELGCKGLTVYVTGSREKVVLETRATRGDKEINMKQATIWPESKKPRASKLRGETHRVTTPLGNTYVTINENGGNQPFEVFIQTSKAGSDTAAVSEAIGRLISYVLRLSSPIPPRDRMEEVIKQLSGIGGGRPMGFGTNRVLSLPDGVAQALEEYLTERQLPDSKSNGQLPMQMSQLLFGDLCPECGEAAFVNEEGCRKCYGCGFSEC